MLKKIASKEYPGYYEIVPTRISRVIGFFQSPKARAAFRPVIIAMMFFVSLLQFGAEPIKATMVSLAAYGMMALPIGGRYIERLGMVVFVIATTLWLDIIDIEQFTSLCAAALH